MLLRVDVVVIAGDVTIAFVSTFVNTKVCVDVTQFGTVNVESLETQ
jgi:hypothetical protein